VEVVAVLDVVDVLPVDETLPATGVPIWILVGMSISALSLGTLMVRRRS
jgi:LPXTG-motif cell wall-anchored protein